MDEQKLRQIIREELSALIKVDRLTIDRLTQYLDGRNVQFGLTTGTKFGTSVSEKIGFWNKTPVIQPTHANQAALSLDTDVTGADTVDKSAINTNFTSIQSLVNQLRSDLVNTGIIKGS